MAERALNGRQFLIHRAWRKVYRIRCGNQVRLAELRSHSDRIDQDLIVSLTRHAGAIVYVTGPTPGRLCAAAHAACHRSTA